MTISPEAVDVIQGGEVQLEATLADDNGGVVSGGSVQWSSDAPTIASVDANGMVRGEAVGTTKIRATYDDISGVADVSVLPPPSIAVSQSEVAMSSGVGGDPPDPRALDITNSGGGPIEGLSATVAYPSDPTGWLTAELGGTSAPATITLTVVTQGLQAGVHAASVSISSTTPGVGTLEVPVTLTLGGMIVQESDGATTVSEDGGSDELTVGLFVQPESDVVLTISSSDASEVAVSPETLTFTPDDWNVAQTVTLTGVDDAELDGDQTSVVTLAVDVAASDGAFADLPNQTISVTTTDDETGALVVLETDGSTTVAESGTTDELTVALGAQPLSDVVLTVSSGDPAEVTAAPSTLTFTPADWSVPQTVTLTGVDDTTSDGDQQTSVTVAVDAAASDDAYDAISAQSVSVTTTDDDVPSIVVAESDGSTLVDESGTTDDFTVALSEQPASNVVLTVTSADPAEVTVSLATLTFTNANWNVAQTVTVTGVDDAEADGDQAIDVTISVDASASADAFDAATDQVVTVTVADDEEVIGVSEDNPQGHPGVAADALVASYDMSTLTTDGLLRDFSGNELHGTIAGTTPVDGVRGGARSFSGDAAERIALPSSSQFDLDGPFTVASWFRIDTPNQHQHAVACDGKFVLWLKASDQVRLANTRSDFGETVDDLSTGEFHSVVGIFRGTAGDQIDTGNVEIWIDGELAEMVIGSAVSPPVWRDGVLPPSDACFIGFENGQGSVTYQDLGFYGVIDEVLVFGRALTPEEVALLAATTP